MLRKNDKIYVLFLMKT